jgi:DNA repair protein RadC
MSLFKPSKFLSLVPLMVGFKAAIRNYYSPPTLLTNQNQVIGFNIAATGSGSSVLVSSREQLKPAILTNAGAIILCYTQPNGDVLPSREDLSNVQKIVRAAWVM